MVSTSTIDADKKTTFTVTTRSRSQLVRVPFAARLRCFRRAARRPSGAARRLRPAKTSTSACGSRSTAKCAGTAVSVPCPTFPASASCPRRGSCRRRAPRVRARRRRRRFRTVVQKGLGPAKQSASSGLLAPALHRGGRALRNDIGTGTRLGRCACVWKGCWWHGVAKNTPPGAFPAAASAAPWHGGHRAALCHHERPPPPGFASGARARRHRVRHAVRLGRHAASAPPAAASVGGSGREEPELLVRSSEWPRTSPATATVPRRARPSGSRRRTRAPRGARAVATAEALREVPVPGVHPVRRRPPRSR